MALVKFSFSDLKTLFPGAKASSLEDDLAALGIPLEGMEEDEASAEITPNRPDWLSVEGIARSLSSFRTGKPKEYSTKPATVEWSVDSSVKSVRPHLGSAIVRGVKTSDAFVASMMQLQEKLHDTLGRNRRKLAIGLHNLQAVEPPFAYLAIGREEMRFVPLGKEAPMTLGQILSSHEKGIAYAHLVGEKCPIILDCNNEVLSFPPIINSERTRVDDATVDFLIDCTGMSGHAVRTAVQIISAALVDRGGIAEEVKINGKPYPLFKPQQMPIPIDAANRMLGMKMGKKEIISHLMRMGHAISGSKVLVPSYRADVMHAADLVEDIAISIGYNNFPKTLPQFHTIGIWDDTSSPIHSILIGLGFTEVLSWMLTNKNVVIKSKQEPSKTIVANPLTEEFSILRPLLFPNHLQVFAQSRNDAMPQRIYEIGAVFPDDGEVEHIAACSCHPKAGWAEAKSALEAFGKSISKPLEFTPANLPGFIDGRSCKILLEGKEIGFAGEIHPEVLVSFGIEQPVCVFELATESLKQ